MKRNAMFALVLASLIVVPAFAQEKSSAESAKGEAKKAEASNVVPAEKRHNHMEERTGIRAKPPGEKAKPVDKSKHSHPRDR